MPSAVLATKLYAPPPRPKAVLRPRLTDQLNEGLGRKLSLICAPAGFGKTAVVSEWLETCGRPVAWLSLDTGDGVLPRFFAHVVAALQTIDSSLAVTLQGQIEASQPTPVESLMTPLLNEIVRSATPMLLVLDDYHAVDSPEVDAAVRFLLEHAPPELHLAITSREDPNLPLARLRASDQLTELRAPDLRFERQEAAEFLRGVMGLELTPRDVALLADRTEGWIAGLQLAALSLRGRKDVSGFLSDFAGDNRYIMDYLLTEVLERQTQEVRTFLLETSVLERLCGPLCEAVTGQSGGTAILEALERGNFFVVSLDDTRHWYRYHHLFRRVLAARLQEEHPTRVADLRRRASEWYEHEGLLSVAIDQALAAADHSRAARLIEVAATELRRTRQEATLLTWLEMLPDAVVANRSELAVLYAHVLMATGQLGQVDELLIAAETRIQASSDDATAPVPETNSSAVPSGQERLTLLANIGIVRAGLAFASGDTPAAVRFASGALQLAPAGDHLVRGGATGFLGLASWRRGDLDAAKAAFESCIRHLEAAGNVADAVGLHLALAQVCLAQGRLRNAADTYARGLRLASCGSTPLRGMADMLVGLAEVSTELGDLAAAERHLRASQDLDDGLGFPQYRYRNRVALARVRAAQGDGSAALELLREAEGVFDSDFYPDLKPVAAERARLLIALGRIDEALDWAAMRGLNADDGLDYLHEFEQLTFARLLIAQTERTEDEAHALDALRLLGRLLDDAERGGRGGSLIRILIAKALNHGALDQMPEALAALDRALLLAEPEGYFQTFVDEGKPVIALLRELAQRRTGPGARYVGRLLSATARPADSSRYVIRMRAGQTLAEPLSERELQVLRLLRSELNGVEIAREMHVSVSTVRTHTQHVYGKLAVNNRRAAVRRAEELQLI